MHSTKWIPNKYLLSGWKNLTHAFKILFSELRDYCRPIGEDEVLTLQPSSSMSGRLRGCLLGQPRAISGTEGQDGSPRAILLSGRPGGPPLKLH